MTTKVTFKIPGVDVCLMLTFDEHQCQVVDGVALDGQVYGTVPMLVNQTGVGPGHQQNGHSLVKL